MDMLKQMVKVLAPFKDATVLMSSEKQCTVSMVEPILQQLMVSLTGVLEEPGYTAAVNTMKATMRNDLEKR